MASIPVPKTLLLLVFLSVIAASPVRAADALVYRFGGWTLITPPDVTPEALSPTPYAMRVPLAGSEFLLYWQDGSQRALSLRFHGGEAQEDLAALKSFNRTYRIKGCALGVPARITSLKAALPKDVEPQPLPDDAALVLMGTERGLRRAGELLVADMGPLRLQIAEDSPLVRVGEWGSAEFCRFELKTEAAEED